MYVVHAKFRRQEKKVGGRVTAKRTSPLPYVQTGNPTKTEQNLPLERGIGVIVQSRVGGTTIYF